MGNVQPFVKFGLNREEVALSIGVSPTSVDAMVGDGSLPPARKWHKLRFWLAREIEAAMQEWPIVGHSQDEPSDWIAVK